ncbi:hypothetical protein TNCV_248731 [Trichonephila clavipes]|nr:hypothetical protein TNCV_248731 [Trichonephila clavipes]
MDQRDAAIRRCWQKWVDNDTLQRYDGSGRGTAAIDLEDRLSCILAVHLSNTSSSSQIATVLSNRVCLGYDGKEMLMTCHDNWSKFGKTYRKRPSGYVITICHVLFQLELGWR